MSGKPVFEIGNTWSSEHNTDVKLNVCVSDKHFRVDLFTANFEANPELLKTYLRHVEHSDPMYIPPPLEDTDEDEFVDPLEEFYDWAMEPFASLFRSIPPLVRDQKYTLQDCLFAEQFVYTLEVADDKLIPVKRDIDPDSRRVGALLPAFKTLNKFSLPVYRPNDIHVRLDDDIVALPTYPRKVYIKGEHTCFFKQVLPGDVGITMTELTTYAKIYAAGFGEDVRISRLLGVIQDERTSRIVGLLLSYIDCENTTLSCAAQDSGRTLHEKWLKQITYSLQKLHALQIVWGDAKPDNVLIDKNNNAYLIDFGGGYTNGWVEKELTGTQEGDLQGLQRITAYLDRLAV